MGMYAIVDQVVHYAVNIIYIDNKHERNALSPVDRECLDRWGVCYFHTVLSQWNNLLRSIHTHSQRQLRDEYYISNKHHHRW